LALVLLRLAIGWHFFIAGVEKVDRDANGEYHVSFSAAPFLNMAKGPLADVFHSFTPSGHDWQKLLALPRQHKPESADEAKAPADQPPQQAWQDRIVSDWQAMTTRVTEVPQLTEDQIQRAKAAFAKRKAELERYLKSEAGAIADYQHEVWRLDQWRATPEAESLPFEQERIAKKEAETTSTAKAWTAGVAEIEASLVNDFREILDPGQRLNIATVATMKSATTGPEQQRLERVSLAATVLTLAVGVCLLVGLFTRTAAIAGAIFLLSVIATQPPWLPTAEPTINQTVELAGLLVLAGTGAGRWLGLDYFTWALFHRHD
jgi:uncharacterized membrane protein YphA (DoxX/SURF4 family)